MLAPFPPAYAWTSAFPFRIATAERTRRDVVAPAAGKHNIAAPPALLPPGLAGAPAPRLGNIPRALIFDEPFTIVDRCAALLVVLLTPVGFTVEAAASTDDFAAPNVLQHSDVPGIAAETIRTRTRPALQPHSLGFAGALTLSVCDRLIIA